MVPVTNIRYARFFQKVSAIKLMRGYTPPPLTNGLLPKLIFFPKKKHFLPKKWFWANFQWIFTRPSLTEGSSLQVEILLDCLIDCLIVRHHFNISNIGSSNHPRIMSDPMYHTSSERGEPHGSFGHKKDDHKDKEKYTDKYKDKDKDKV